MLLPDWFGYFCALTMKNKVLFYFVLLISWGAFGQSNWQDNFSDGDFTNNPSWNGTTANFRISNGELQLYDTTLSGISWLSTASTAAFDGFWSFRVRLEFTPSTQNFAQIFLMSDVQDVSGAASGYFVRIGGTTARRISLIRRSGTTNTILVESADNVVNTNVVNARIRVENQSGVWTLKYDTSTAATPTYQVAGTAFDTTFRKSSFFGILCRYTSTRFDKMFFDDFVVDAEEFRDTIPPIVKFAIAESDTQIRIRFSEAVRNTALNPVKYIITPDVGFPSVVSFAQGREDEVILTLPIPLEVNKPYTLSVEEIEDLAGNEIEKVLIPISFIKVRPFDIVFNEIMADPTPVVGLPDAEYVELYNRLPVAVSLNGWRMMVNNTTISLSGTIPPDSFIVITRSQSVNLFPSDINITGVSMSPTQLVNSGAFLRLFDSDNQLIHFVTYSDQWYSSSIKREGGWSLEQIDPENFCGQQLNWQESIHHSGGTPGRKNSVLRANPDTTQLRIQNLSISTSQSIKVYYNKPMHPNPDDWPDFAIIPDPGIVDVQYDPLALNALLIELANELMPGVEYQLTSVVEPVDCQGKTAVNQRVAFGLPLSPEPGDVVLNELLFNQPTGGSKFVEIVNVSNKVLDLSQLRLCNLQSGEFVNVTNISEEPLLFLPGSYLAVTTSASGVLAFYQTECENCLMQAQLPTMNIGSGNVALINNNAELLDYFEYDEKMHSPMVRNPKGVSLERISFDSPTNDNRYWKSAAEVVGFATPGYKNSQQKPSIDADESFWAEPKTFSPNNDGYNDFVTFHFNLEFNNAIGTLKIFDVNGNLIKTIASSELMANRGYFIWDGTDDRGRKTPIGIYAVILEIFHQEIGKRIFKTSVGLIY
ncbi:CHU domain-containing protein [Schleiferia thermophila]|uniref:CHU domain-containing protein n=2 Tax=Schleiferia thermophila TaxID=884107 RepID=A0A369A933_9FLAO|nr:CHU domain-containing protein [Schleiferia thermophila]